ncbi:MAG: hypothetical protein ACMUIU_12820 [bacterium]
MKSAIIFLTLFCLIIFLLTTISFASNITRSCNAYYEVTTNHRGETINITLGEFSTKGSCGRTVPNRCRTRASNSAHDCMKAHWALSDRADMFWRPCTDNYPITEQCLRCVIEEKICGIIQADKIFVNVKAVTKGDKGCNKTTVLASRYPVNCNTGITRHYNKPTRPVLTYPAHNGTQPNHYYGRGEPWRFYWQASSCRGGRIAGYRIMVRCENCSVPAVDEITEKPEYIGDTIGTIGSGYFVWRVQAIDDRNQVSEWSDGRRFYVPPWQ